MFEQEIEMEKKEGSSFGPVLIILLMVGLFVGGIGFVVYQSKLTIKPEEATAAVQQKLTATAPVTITFHTGNLSYGYADKPSNPQYKLLEKAGILKIGKMKNYASEVELTPAGKELLARLPGVKTVVGDKKDNSTAYTLPLATRKLVSVGAINKLGQQKFQVQYTWAWQPTEVGEMFDINGKLVQGLANYDRSLLIDQHGGNYYHAAPAQSAIVFAKGDKGWEPASAN